MKRKGLRKGLSILAIVLVVITALGWYFTKKYGKIQNSELKSNTKEVIYGNINVKISGDGVIQPLERYDITPLVYGNIEECNFNETDVVKKDDVLYKFETFTVENSIKKLENDLERLYMNQDKLRENLSKVEVTAPHNGRLSGFNIKKDENVSGATVGQIIDDSYHTIEVFYNKAQIEKMHIGQEATVVIPAVMSSDKGAISKISDTFIPMSNGVSLYSVEIIINKKMSITEGTFVYSIIDGIQSVGDGRIKEFKRYPIVPEISGKVKEVYFSNNEYVTKGQVLFAIDDENYQRALKESQLDIYNAQLSLEATKKNLEDYSVKSPIDGIVLSKEYKAGDSINSNYKGTALMVVANMSAVKFNMSIDELDIAKIKKGQDVTVTAAALANETFQGKVTSVAEEGTSINGVTSYTVEVTIEEPGELKSGMNIDAVIVIENKEHVLIIPSLGVNKEGTQYYVNVYREGQIEKRYVKIGSSDSSNVEIVNGLKEGEIIIDDNSGNIANLLAIDNLRKMGEEEHQNMMYSMAGGGIGND